MTRHPLVPLFSLLLLFSTICPARSAERPNVVWILSEDNSVHYLRLYGDPLGPTPRIEQLAKQGIVFEHAFSCSPVCSVARTTLMSGMYAPRVGFQYHRKQKLAQLPGGAQLFPAYLKRAGYYTTNNAKKDYNVVEGDVWHESSRRASWRKRPDPAMPFFHMESSGLSHESSLHFKQAQMKPDQLTTPVDQVQLAPYHPDTPTFRYTHARYHDRMRAIDEVVGGLVDRLKADGLLEDTFIFYFGDHGGVLPRSKGYVYESGLHVPLVVRIPENWKDHVATAAGTRSRGFVSFVDFGPTVLKLAGLPVPDSMDGQPFLGKDVDPQQVEARSETFGHADRFDEKYDLCRSLRQGRFKYIRNYQAFYPDALQNNYRYRMLAYAEWRKLYGEGKLNAAQRLFFEAKPVEALYEIERDPHEVNNLAGDPQHAEQLVRLRKRLQQRVKAMPDLSFVPESVLIEEGLPDGVAYGRKHAARIRRLIDVADLAILPWTEAEPNVRAALDSPDPWQRYWALIVCSCFGKKAQSVVPAARERLEDTAPLVRVRAAEFLALAGAGDPRPTLYDVLAKSQSAAENLLTLNTVVFLHDHLQGNRFDVKKIQLRVRSPEVQRRIDYLNAKNN